MRFRKLYRADKRKKKGIEFKTVTEKQTVKQINGLRVLSVTLTCTRKANFNLPLKQAPGDVYFLVDSTPSCTLRIFFISDYA